MIKYDWPRVVSPRKPAIIYVFADTHFGNPNVDMKLLKQHIEMCRRERAGWFHLGDWCEFIGPRDRRFSINNPPPSLTEQIDLAYETFYPIRKQGIACLSGNHEEVIEREIGSVMKGHGGIASLLGIEYLGDMGFVSFRYRKGQSQSQGTHSHVFFLWHGHGMGRLLGAKTINLQRLSHKFEANTYLIGHAHTYIQHIDKLKGISRPGAIFPTLKDLSRKYAIAPCYFDPYLESDKPNYVTARALYPQHVGCLRMEIWYNESGGRDNTRLVWKTKIEPLLGDER